MDSRLLKILLPFFCIQVFFLLYIFVEAPTAFLRHSTIGPVLTPSAFADVYTEYTVAQLQMEPLRGVRGIRPDFGAVINNVTVSYEIPLDRCKEKRSVFNQSVFIGIVSAPENVDRRNSIRRTWLPHLYEEHYHQNLMDVIGIAFLIGKTSNQSTQTRIEKEAVRHNDILQFGVMDGYYKLSAKAAAFLDWINNNCNTLDFVLKVDDDVFVNVRNLATILKDLSPFENNIYGCIAKNLSPTRQGKWSTSLKVWPWSNYPPYLLGPSVLIPGRAIEPLLAAIQTVPYYHIDDVYLTGICSFKANLPLVNLEKIYRFVVPSYPDACFTQGTVTWLTSSVDHMNLSSIAVERLWQNERAFFSHLPWPFCLLF